MKLEGYVMHVTLLGNTVTSTSEPMRHLLSTLMSVRNIPLADFAETKICYFSTLPNELLLIIAKIIPLKDRLALGDTCSTCRSFVSEKDCLKACRDAGLSVIPNVSGRVMAKLLCRPRVGVCNWSTDGGEPKGVSKKHSSEGFRLIYTYSRIKLF